MQFEGIVCWLSWYFGIVFLVEVKKTKSSLIPNELPLDIPSVHLHLSLVAGWLNVSTVGQEEQLCQLRAAEVVYMN